MTDFRRYINKRKKDYIIKTFLENMKKKVDK